MPRAPAAARILNAEQLKTNLLLIQAVRERPLLYYPKLHGSKYSKAKKEVWEEVQRITKMNSANACKKRWKSLRDDYVRQLRDLEKGKIIVPSPYFEHLGFYRDCTRAPRTYLRQDRAQQNNEESSESSRKPPPYDPARSPEYIDFPDAVRDPEAPRKEQTVFSRGGVQVAEVVEQPFDLSKRASMTVRARDTSFGAIAGAAFSRIPGCSFVSCRAGEEPPSGGPDAVRGGADSEKESLPQELVSLDVKDARLVHHLITTLKNVHPDEKDRLKCAVLRGIVDAERARAIRRVIYRCMDQ